MVNGKWLLKTVLKTVNDTTIEDNRSVQSNNLYNLIFYMISSTITLVTEID